MTYRTILNSCKDHVHQICKAHNIPDHHGLPHAKRVDNISTAAYPNFYLQKSEKLSISLACLLHDVDDPKFFTVKPNNKYPNTRQFLDKAVNNKWMHIDETRDVLKMISLVSYSKNKNIVNPDIRPWMYIPRDADRIDAGGKEGIQRFVAMCEDMKRPLMSGPLPLSIDDLRSMCIDGPTDNSSALRFYITDWWNRGQCASKSGCLSWIMKKEYDTVEEWIMKLVVWCRNDHKRIYDYYGALSLI